MSTAFFVTFWLCLQGLPDIQLCIHDLPDSVLEGLALGRIQSYGVVRTTICDSYQTTLNHLRKLRSHMRVVACVSQN